MRAISSTLFCLLLGATGSAVAQNIYKWTDAQGRVHYGNTPQDASQRKALPVSAGPMVSGIYVDETEFERQRAIERRLHERSVQVSTAQRERELHEARLKTEELQQARMQQETALLKARQEAEERCARRGECGGTASIVSGTVVYPATVVIQRHPRSNQTLQQAAPFPTTPYRTATTESLNRPQIYAPPGNSALYGWQVR